MLADLPRRLEEYLCGEIPGQRLFLDYCHLNVEGIKVAMAFAAETLLPLLDQPGYGWDYLSKIDLPISRQLEGEAQFLAAVHNGNWGQGSEIIRPFLPRSAPLLPGSCGDDGAVSGLSYPPRPVALMQEF